MIFLDQTFLLLHFWTDLCHSFCENERGFVLCENERAQHHVDQQTHAIFHIIFQASRNMFSSRLRTKTSGARASWQREHRISAEKITHKKRSLVLVEREGRKHGQTYGKDFFMAVHHSCQENDNRKKHTHMKKRKKKEQGNFCEKWFFREKLRFFKLRQKVGFVRSMSMSGLFPPYTRGWRLCACTRARESGRFVGKIWENLSTSLVCARVDRTCDAIFV